MIEQILSPETLKERRILAWTVQAILISKSFSVKKKRKPKKPKVQRDEGKRKIVVYRGYFVRLLSHPKPLEDQLIIELPTLNAFRTNEVATLQAEDIDLNDGNIDILDSKKKAYLTRPLDPVLGQHLDQFLHEADITEGLVFRAGKYAGRKSSGPLTPSAIQKRWKQLCKLAGVPPLSPRKGRAYFAVIEHFVLGKPIAYVQFMLRHENLESTEHYVNCDIVCYEDMKALFLQGKPSPFSQMKCRNSAGCLGAMPDCHCRLFEAQKVEV